MGEDDILLNADDLLDIFGAADDKAGSKEGLGDFLQDIFFGGGQDSPGEDGGPVAAKPPVEAAAGPAAPSPALDPASYEEFKRRVIERHEMKQAEEARQAVQGAPPAALDGDEERRREMAARYEAQRRALEAEEAQARQREEDGAGDKDKEARIQAMVEKYKKAKEQAQAAQAGASMGPGTGLAEALDDGEKERHFREYLQSVKARMASGGMPRLQHARPAAQAPESAPGPALDIPACQALARMFEETRLELTRRVADKIGTKAARSLMMKTLEKILKAQAQVFNRAAQDFRGQLRADGALDEERLARNLHALPQEGRAEAAQRALHDLMEMRFIAIELGLGVRAKGFLISQTLQAIEAAFEKKGYPPELVKWYLAEVVPSTNLSDGDEETY